MQIRPRHYDPPASDAEQAAEWALCEASPLYFLLAYCWVFNATEKAWIPFELWPAQRWALVQLMRHQLTIVLKARQLGFTWLILGYILWQMLFRPVATIGVFSRTEDDASELLDIRLKGMYSRLPAFMRCRRVEIDNVYHWKLSNGSSAMAFATNGGRGNTFSYVLSDEADHQPNLGSFLEAVKPTIDAGGHMVMLSSSNKSSPASLFKQIYRAAKQQLNEWHNLFLPWHARPGRTVNWYAAQKRDGLANTGSLDSVHQEYPATDTEALAPRTLDKRIPGTWIEQNYAELTPLPLPPDAPSLPGLELYALPVAGVVYPTPTIGSIYSSSPGYDPIPGECYVIGVDPAEGNPTSDDSSLTVMNRRTGEEVAALAGKVQPQTIADYAHAVGVYFNNADILVERNNHGHAVLLQLSYQTDCLVLDGNDGRPGWLSSVLGKTVLYDALADAFRLGETTLHSFATYVQIASIEGNTLRAPVGFHDDRSDSYALAHVARAISVAVNRDPWDAPDSILQAFTGLR